MADPVAAYQTAYEEFGKAYDKGKRIAKFLMMIGDYMSRWESVSVTNAGIAYPASAVGSRMKTINADDWPTAELLGQTLADFHKAKAALDAAWHAVPADRRSGLAYPPPG